MDNPLFYTIIYALLGVALALLIALMVLMLVTAWSDYRAEQLDKENRRGTQH